MNKDLAGFRSLLKPYFLAYRRMTASSGFFSVLKFSAAGSAAVSAAALFTSFPAWPALILMLFPPAAAGIYFLVKPVDTGDFCLRLDRLMRANQTIPAFYEAVTDGDTPGPYYNILKKRTVRYLESGVPGDLFPFLSAGSAAVPAILVFFTLLILAAGIGFNGMDILESPADYINEAGEKLAVRDDLKEYFSSPMNELMALEKDKETEKDAEVVEEEIRDMKEEIAEHLDSLRRDSLSSLVEEKKIDRETGDFLSEMLEKNIDIRDTREFVIDLLSGNTLTDQQRSMVLKSYEDYSSEQEGPESSSLAEDIIDTLSPDTGEAAGILEDASESLDKALESLNGRPESAAASGESTDEGNSDKNGISASKEGVSRDALEEESGAHSAEGSAGKEKNMSVDNDSFKPSGEEGLTAYLPEGDLIIDGDTGIMRMESEDELTLERTEGIYSISPFTENTIRRYEVPSGMKGLVQQYFTYIGGISLED